MNGAHPLEEPSFLASSTKVGRNRNRLSAADAGSFPVPRPHLEQEETNNELNKVLRGVYGRSDAVPLPPSSNQKAHKRVSNRGLSASSSSLYCLWPKELAQNRPPVESDEWARSILLKPTKEQETGNNREEPSAHEPVGRRWNKNWNRERGQKQQLFELDSLCLCVPSLELVCENKKWRKRTRRKEKSSVFLRNHRRKRRISWGH